MPPPAPGSADASQGSYAMRSQNARSNIPPMPNQAANMPGAQSYGNVGMNVGMNGAGSNVQPYVPLYNQTRFQPSFGPIAVTDPILVQSPGVFAGPPHWTYAVVVRDVKKIEGQNEFAAVVSNVRRRFRHFVALEERTRADRPGAILPPRYVKIIFVAFVLDLENMLNAFFFKFLDRTNIRQERLMKQVRVSLRNLQCSGQRSLKHI